MHLVLRGVSGSFVGGVVFGGFGLSGVMDLGDVSAVVIDGVSHGLGTAIGQENVVRSGHDFTVAVLLVAVVVVGVVVDDLVGEVIRHGVLQRDMEMCFKHDAMISSIAAG